MHTQSSNSSAMAQFIETNIINREGRSFTMRDMSTLKSEKVKVAANSGGMTLEEYLAAIKYHTGL